MKLTVRWCFICLVMISTLIACQYKQENRKATYETSGEIESVEKTGGVVDGIKSEYTVKLKNITPNPSPKDMDYLSLSITKNAKILDGQNHEIDVTALTPGSHVDATWRFANDHLTEATKIIIK